MERNTTISICKGIGIILMVIGHAEAPELITNFIYTFHMPLFFIAAGYFFKKKYLQEPFTFCKKRFKGLYVPFVIWSIIFLILHNPLHHIGILNETYGNWTGGVTHPYTWQQFWQRLTSIVFSMGGYDEFLAGAFWFFRTLLLSSIIFLFAYILLDNRTKWLKGNVTVITICVLCLLFAVFKTATGVKIYTVMQGGMRETWGVFFFGLGVLYKAYEHKLRLHWSVALLFLGLLCVAAYLHLSGINIKARMQDILTLPITGTIGFLTVHYISTIINRHDNGLKRLLCYIGNNTLYIFIFHIAAYKLVSLLKIWWYDLDFLQIGCHMVIHYNHTDIFWVLYSIAGVAVPLLGLEAVRKLKRAFSNAHR